MEEKILEIINERFAKAQLDWCDDPSENTAKEITTHVFEFIEWYVTKGQFEHSFLKTGIEDSLRDAYKYWLTKIKR